MAEVERRLAALPGVQSSRTASVLGFRQPDLARSCGAWTSPVIFSAARIGVTELRAGASAIALLGSEPEGCCEMKNFEPLASAARPNTASNEITTPAFRQERGLEPKYPNSGCTPGAKRIAIPLATILRSSGGPTRIVRRRAHGLARYRKEQRKSVLPVTRCAFPARRGRCRNVLNPGVANRARLDHRRG